MCKECGRMICPPGCPEFSGRLAGRGAAVGHCALCGRYVYADEALYKRDAIAVCEECERGMSLRELGMICGVDEIDSPLSLCGFERVYGWGKDDRQTN